VEGYSVQKISVYDAAGNSYYDEGDDGTWIVFSRVLDCNSYKKPLLCQACKKHILVAGLDCGNELK
jgi:hypothetical protein